MKYLSQGARRNQLFICSLMVCLAFFFTSCSNLPAEHAVVRSEGGEIKIPVPEVNDGKVHFFTYKESGKRINFFVRTDGTGALSTYFDACFTCNKFRKGYRCEGTDLICNECNLKFRLSDEHWDNSQGCSPIALKSSIDNAFVRIKTADLEKGQKLF